jgi:hypothetical protein
MGGKKSGVNAGSLAEDVRETRTDLSGTMDTLAAKAHGKRRAGLAAAATGLLASVAAVGAMRWRKSRQAPKSRAERAWRGMQRQVRKTVARIR